MRQLEIETHKAEMEKDQIEGQLDMTIAELNKHQASKPKPHEQRQKESEVTLTKRQKLETFLEKSTTGARKTTVTAAIAAFLLLVGPNLKMIVIAGQHAALDVFRINITRRYRQRNWHTFPISYAWLQRLKLLH